MTLDLLGNKWAFEPGPEGIPNLADAIVAGGLVHDFVARVFESYKQFQHGKITRDESMNEIYDLDKEFGSTIMGRNPDVYVAKTHLNGLKANIRRQDTISFKETSDPGEAFFRWLSIQAIKAAMDVDTGTAVAEVGPALQGTLRSATAFIQGIDAYT